MFTGLAKEKFEEWYISMYHENRIIKKIEVLSLSKFYKLPIEFQWGIIEDFADSLGYEISVGRYFDLDLGTHDNRWDFDVDGHDSNELLKTRQEARTEAIKKLNELINERI